MDKSKFRENVKEIREREWIRDSLKLRNRTSEDSLKTMFDLCEFAAQINKAKRIK